MQHMVWSCNPRYGPVRREVFAKINELIQQVLNLLQTGDSSYNRETPERHSESGPSQVIVVQPLASHLAHILRESIPNGISSLLYPGNPGTNMLSLVQKWYIYVLLRQLSFLHAHYLQFSVQWLVGTSSIKRLLSFNITDHSDNWAFSPPLKCCTFFLAASSLMRN